MAKISVVINTLNEAKNITRAINSVKNLADEIIVCDMYSDDDSAIIARKLGAKVILHKRLNFVEPARNFAISKVEGEWVLVLDPDEEATDSLAGKLKEIANSKTITTFVEIPRKNIIFNKWVKSAMWWPDYNIRFFKKGFVNWTDKIHLPPKTSGQGVKLPIDERWAITHHHYDSITQFITRLNRYTDVQANQLKESGVEFNWSDLITKPVNEFLARYFAHKGFEDGLHGLSLSLLQAFSFLIVYLKLWEIKEFREQELQLTDVERECRQVGDEVRYWFKYGNLSKNPLKSFLQRAKNKLTP